MGVAFIPNAKIRFGLYADAATFEARKFFDLENASNFSLSFSEEEKTLLDYRTGAGGTDASVKRISAMSSTIDLRHATVQNLALALWGTTAALNATPLVDEAGYKINTNTFVPTKRIIDTSVAPVVKKGATTVLAADYTVSPGGILIANTITTGGVANGDSITISYTPKAGGDVQSLLSSAPQVSVHVEGINQVDGKYFVGKLWKCKIGVAQNLPFISDDFATITISLTVEKDETIVTAGVSQYAQLQFNS
jgi:hypothetical protein